MTEKQPTDEMQVIFTELVSFIRRKGSHGIKFQTGTIHELSHLLSPRIGDPDPKTIEKMLSYLIRNRLVDFIKLSISYAQFFMKTSIPVEELYQEWKEYESP
jgi:hypothetical protein